jgi:transcriptional regulator with XRE-family HTH domain
MIDEKHFSCRLQKARNIRGLSQLALASMAELPAASISHFESGRRMPSVESLIKMTNALFVSADYLLGLSPIMDSRQKPGELEAALAHCTEDGISIVTNFAKMISDSQRLERAEKENEKLKLKITESANRR